MDVTFRGLALLFALVAESTYLLVLEVEVKVG